ncbi:hypothetical protein OPV22_025041 [Ensete ventricosum]|uniref:Uncharacterized protein n=1 Tax=Ensete ventricosum TaxID=4639 RepID=A0AAV8QBL1_ENSVE|nr:hypothetical protein OPV22_025041 [Ensete ventricosum]
MYRAELFNVLLGRVDWKWKESFVCTLPVTSSHLSDNELIAEYFSNQQDKGVLEATRLPHASFHQQQKDISKQASERRASQ